jgi:hypothetical protein
MWFLLQGSITFAVMASNIHWQWTPNPYLAGALGALLAWVATRMLSEILSMRHRSK